MYRKKINLLVILMSFTLISNAQLKRGDKMIGASIASVFFNNGTTDRSNTITTTSIKSDNFGISLTPNIGWFVSDNFNIGFSPSMSFSKKKQLGKTQAGSSFLKDELSQYNFSLGGFARYYFNGNNTAMRFFGQYNLNLGITGGKNEGFEYETLGAYVDRYNTKFSGGFAANTGVNLGFSKFLNDVTSLDFYVGYNFSYNKTNPKGTASRDYSDPSTADESQDIDYEEKITSNNIVLGVGLQVFIKGKKK